LPEGTGRKVEELIKQMIQKDPNERLNIYEVLQKLQ
jgi:hypothetical protein